MRYFLIGIGVLVVVVVGAVFVVPALVPADTVKAQIANAVGEATGREVTIAGDARVSLLPRLELELQDVAVANAVGGAAPKMITLKQLVVRLRVLPLLRREVVVDRFVLVEPVINLEIDAAGRANWTFADAGTGPIAPAAGAPVAGASSTAGAESSAGGVGVSGLSLSELSLGEVRLVDGMITYADARSGSRYGLEAVNLALTLTNLDTPLTADGGATLNGEAVSLRLGVEEPRALLTGGATTVDAEVQSDTVALTYSGSLARGADGPTAGGLVVLNVPSMAALSRWLDIPLGAAAVIERISIDGELAMANEEIAFRQARIRLDDMSATGDLTIDMSGGKPSLRGGLAVDRLDVNRFMPPAVAEPAGGPPQDQDEGQAQAQDQSRAGSQRQDRPRGQGAGAPVAAGWSNEPIDVSGLQAANVDFALTADSLLFRNIEVGASAVDLKLVDGLLTLDLTRLELYDGNGAGRVVVDGRGAAPSVDSRFTLAGVQAMPLLRDAAGYRLLEGTGAIEFDLSTRGQSQREMVAALDGNGSVKFVDGAINGINLAAMVRNVAAAFTQGAAAAQKTDFAELSGTFTITDGQFANNDLLLLNPLIRVTGAGTADLPARTVAYRVEPKVVASLEGQGAEADRSGLAVPVIVEGPWDDLSYRPDLAGLADQLLEDPGAAVESVTRAVEGTPKVAVASSTTSWRA